MLWCPYLEGYHRSNCFVLELSGQGFRIRCFSKKKSKTGKLCSESHLDQPFLHIAPNDRTEWSEAIAALLPTPTSMSSKRRKVGKDNADILARTITYSTKLNKANIQYFSKLGK